MENKNDPFQEPENFNDDANENGANSSNSAIDNCDFIEQTVYDNLPSLLKDACNIFNDRHERDIFLIGALTVLGGSFHNLYAYNDVGKKKVATNLLSFIVAPPASGKGALNYARKIIVKIKETFADKSKQYGSKELAKLEIPANNSVSGVIQLLQRNKGVGVMLESEIDTLVNANKQDWGNYSDILRNAFENETSTLYRKTDKEYAEIKNIKLSLAVSGTPNQFKRLMGSTENGLFSRGCYYVFENINPKLSCYDRMNPAPGKDLDTQFAEIAEIANTYYDLHLGFEKVQVIFDKNQLDQIQTTLQAEFNRVFNISDLGGSIKRSFVIALKIATILTFLQECEKGELKENLYCSKSALESAISLMKTFLNHSYNAYDLLPKKDKGSLNVNQGRLFYELPNEFSRTEAIQKANEIGISKRTMDDYIKVFKEKGMIEKSGTDKYKKKE